MTHSLKNMSSDFWDAILGKLSRMGMQEWYDFCDDLGLNCYDTDTEDIILMIQESDYCIMTELYTDVYVNHESGVKLRLHN